MEKGCTPRGLGKGTLILSYIRRRGPFLGVQILNFNIYLFIFFWGGGVREMNNLGDNCIQNFHLGRYIVGYTVGYTFGNHFLRRRVSGAVKLNHYEHKILNMVIPILMHLCS